MKALVPLLLLSTLPIAAEDPKMTPIWKVSDADSTVFLAGSVHLLREEDLPLPTAFDRVYAEAEDLVFEIDMRTMASPETVSEMRRLSALPDGETLADRFGEETMERLRDYAMEQGKPAGFFDSFTPGMTYLMVSLLEASRHGAKPELGLESTFFTKAVTDGKPSRGLETVAFQISCLGRFEDAKLEEWILASLQHLEEEEGHAFDKITEAWRKGEGEKLAAILKEDPGYSPELYEVLLVERNRNWIPEIEKALAEKHDVMFLVGAAHLVGDDGLVELLTKKGLVVTQLESAP